MEVLEPIYMAPDMTFPKRDINEWGSRYEPKNNYPGGLNKVCW